MHGFLVVAVVVPLLTGSPPFAGKGNSYLGKPAPEIDAKDSLNRTGRTRVAQHRGEGLILESFATWCGPCRLRPPLREGKRTAVGRWLSKLTETAEGRAREFIESGITVIDEAWVARRTWGRPPLPCTERQTVRRVRRLRDGVGEPVIRLLMRRWKEGRAGTPLARGPLHRLPGSGDAWIAA